MSLTDWLLLGNIVVLIYMVLSLRNGFIVSCQNQVAVFKEIQKIQSSTNAMDNYMQRYLKEKDNGNC
jgi:hypothetical protein